jgi:hypothetical protein
MQRRGDFQVFVIVATVAAATPTLGQNVTPVVGSATGVTQSAASIPDFSGIWAHMSLPGFEPPQSGPGPVLNKSRESTGKGKLTQLVGDYTNPILKPSAAEVVRTHGEISLSGVPYGTPRNQCWPGGVPFVFTSNGMQMLQQPDKITILYSNDHEVRHVRMDDLGRWGVFAL